jgi:hypothetical protein
MKADFLGFSRSHAPRGNAVTACYAVQLIYLSSTLNARRQVSMALCGNTVAVQRAEKRIQIVTLYRAARSNCITTRRVGTS